MTNLQIPITTMTTQITDTGITISSFKDTTEQNIDNLERHIDELEEDIDFFDNKRQETEETVSTLNGDVSILNVRTNDHLKRIETLEKTLIEYQNLSDYLFKKIDNLENLLKLKS